VQPDCLISNGKAETNPTGRTYPGIVNTVKRLENLL
jgi:hypothetical protein